MSTKSRDTGLFTHTYYTQTYYTHKNYVHKHDVHIEATPLDVGWDLMDTLKHGCGAKVYIVQLTQKTENIM